jgi:hypothetical protein
MVERAEILDAATVSGKYVAMRRRTATYHLADVIIPEGVQKFVLSRRAAGLSWRRIVLEMRDVTGARVDVSHETLRSWFPDEPANGEAA